MSKHNCFAAQALDMMLKLVAPEYSNKTWNYNKAFLDFLVKWSLKAAGALNEVYLNHIVRKATALSNTWTWFRLLIWIKRFDICKVIQY